MASVGVSMQVEIWADVVCPWCYVGKARFIKALEAFPHRDQVTVLERSFQLDPAAPPGRGMPVREMLRRKYGMGDAQLKATTSHLAALAAAEGIAEFHSADNWTGNTMLAHRLIALAGAKGKRSAAWDRLYRAYFGEKRLIYDVDALMPLALELGLDEAEVRQALSGDAHLAEVEADVEIARRLGVRGVPFFALDRKLAVSGAQPVEVFVEALTKAWTAGGYTVPDAPGCGPDSCAVDADVSGK